MWVGRCGAVCLSRSAPLCSARLQEVGGWRQRGQEDPFQISSSSRQCQTSRLRTKYLLHQRAPFCEGERSEWVWMNRLKTDPVLAQPVAHLVPSALSPPSPRAQPMIPENRYSWYTNLTHVSRTAKHKINYILPGLQNSISVHWKGTLHDTSTVAGFQRWLLVHVRRVLIIRSTHTESNLKVLILYPDQDWQATSESHLPCQCETRGLSALCRARADTSLEVFSWWPTAARLHSPPNSVPHHCPNWWKLMDCSISIWGSRLCCQPILISCN